MKNKDLASIVNKVQRNKKRYFEQLYDVTWETVYFLSFKMMENEKDAEDVSQEIFVKLYEQINDLKIPEAFNQWMNQMIMNTCKNALKKRSKVVNNIENDEISQIENRVEELNKEFLPMEFVDSKETRTMVGQTIQELPEKQKQAVLLHYYEELTIPEIAQILECSSGVVNNRLYFAKKSMEMKIQTLQKEQNIKLYSITGAPAFVIALKQYASEMCTDSVKADLWQRIGTSLNFGVLALSFGWIKKKIFKNNSSKSSVGTSVSGVSTVLTKAIAVLAVASVVVTSSVLGNELLNNSDGKNGNLFNQGNQQNGQQGGTEPNHNSGNPGTDGNERSEKEGDLSDITVSEETNFTQGKSSTINGGNQDKGIGEVVKGSPIASVSTLSSQMELPAGSVVTNNEGDRLYLSQFGHLDSENNLVTQGSIARVPSEQVAYISVDEAGNKILPENSYITLPTGETTCYPGKIQIHNTYNFIKKLPVVVDVKEGDMTIVAQEDQLVLSVNGTETIVPKDTVIDVINTGKEERTVLIDGCSVTFGVLEAELKTINQGNAVFSNKNEMTETTYTTGKTLVYKTNGVKGQVATEVSGSTVQENPIPISNNKGSAVSGIPEKGPNYIKLIVIGTINILSLGYLIFLGLKKRKERDNMKLNKTIKKVCALGLALLLIGGMAIPSAFAQIDENTQDTTTQTEKTLTEGTDPIVPEKPELGPPASAGEPETTPEPTGTQPLAPTVEPATAGVTDLVADTTTLEEAFPDAAFRKYVAETVLGKATYVDDVDKGTVLIAADITKIKAFKTMIVSDLGIVSMEGVQHFKALTSLKCQSNQLTDLDVSQLVLLTNLQCFNNQLTELDISSSGNLITLLCYTNKLTKLDVSGHSNLANLQCQSNQLTDLKVANLANLKALFCNGNLLTELDVSGLTATTDLRCHSNKLTELDVSSLVNLTSLQCQGNQLTALDVSSLGNLTTLQCYNNQLTELDISSSGNLITLLCYTNKLTKLDVSGHSNLANLQCQSNQLTNLKVANLANLKTLICNGNLLTELDVSGLTAATDLRCHDNKLTELDVSQLTLLTQLYCYNNLITELDVSQLASLTLLYCATNPIKTLAIQNLVNLTTLNYWGTDIETLDLAGINKLTSLGMTKASNAQLNNLTTFMISGSRGAADNRSSTRISVDTGGISWNSEKGYYVIAPNMNGKGYFTISAESSRNGYLISDVNGLDLSVGGLIDEEGNLVIGASLSDVNADGTITMPPGSSIATPEGVFTFDGPTSLKDGKISTEGQFTFAKNIVDVNPDTGVATPVVGGIVTKIEPGNGVSTISTNGSEMDVPAGTAVTKNDGDKTYLTAPTIIDSTGNIVTSNGSAVTVPADKVANITEEDGKIYFPGGSTITDKDGNKTVYPGEIEYDTTDNSVKLLPYELDLAAGDITITENAEGKLVITQDGVETILSGDTVLNVKNTGNTDNKIIVDGTGSLDGITVNFGNVDGDLEALNGSAVTVNGDVKGDITIDDTSTVTVTGIVEGNIINKGGTFTITGDVKGDVTTTEGGQTKVDGNVTGNVNTDGAGSKTEVTGDVDKNVTTTNGGETIVGGKVGGDVKTDGPGSKTDIGGDVTGKIETKNGGETTVKGEKLPYELDLAAGNIVVTENPEGKLVITQDGVETILSGDTVLNVKNTGNTDNKITVDGTGSVDGITVNFGNVDGDLEALNGSNVTVNGNVKGDITIDDTSTVTVTGIVEGNIINKGGTFTVTGDVKGNVTTTEGGQTKVDGNVTGDVTTDGAGSKTEVTGDVGGNVTTTNGGETIVGGNVAGSVESKDGGKTTVGGKVNGDVKTDGKDAESKVGGDVDGKVTDTNGGKTIVDGDSHYALKTDKAYDLLGKINGLDLSKYTDNSVKALNDAKAALMEILEPSGPQAFAILPDPSQESLDAAVATLQAAYDGLVLKSQVVDPTNPTQNGTNTNGTANQTQSTTSAKTGDETNARLYVGLFLIGFGLLAGVVAVQRKRKAS